MKNRILFVFILVLMFSFHSKVLANELCSLNGYSVVTINGIITDEAGAKANSFALGYKLGGQYNNQPLTVDYLYNQTHLGGMGDIIDAVAQGVFKEKSDYDLSEMLNDASQKVATQKILLVGHSQGNFYANNFYDKTASRQGGVPSQSIGVYGVATPASHVAGGGKYLTSDTDTVINTTRAGSILNVLKANTHIDFKPSDGDSLGHDFSKIYLTYEGDRIVSDIKFSLDKLQNNNEQNLQKPCISPPELTTLHKVEGVALNMADFIVNNTNQAAIYLTDGVYNVGAAIGSGLRKAGLAVGDTFTGLFANVVGSFTGGKTVAVVPSNNIPSIITSNFDEGRSNQSTQNSTSSLGVTLAEKDSSSSTENVEEAQSDQSVVSDDNKDATDDTINDEQSTTSTSTIETTLPNLGGGGGGGITITVPTVPVPTVDTTAPVITILGNTTETVLVGATYLDAGATASDNIDGAVSVTTSGSVDTDTIGSYTITYSATDKSNNTSTLTRTINVVAPPPAPLNTITISTDTTLGAGEYNYDNLVVTNNAVLTLESDPKSSNNFKGVKLNAVNITIDSGSSISANGKGYDYTGPGSSTGTAAGASYGGLGERGALPTSTYGSAKDPTDLGSGGYGYTHGGGAIKLVVTDTITNNGKISADGDQTSSGGSIYVTTKNLTGNGSFSADGGGLHFGDMYFGSGGGGRVAIYYQTSSFNGIAETKGGCGSYDSYTKSCAKDGTVGFFDTLDNDLTVNTSWLFQKNDSPFNFNHIILTNGAQVTTEEGTNITASNLLVDKASQFTLSDNQISSFTSISINSGSTMTLSKNDSLTAGSLTIAGNSNFTVIPEQILSLTIPNISIDANSSISASSKGYMDGPGIPPIDSVAGASYGGVGLGNVLTSVYGSDTEPTDLGSGGTNYFRGGGAVRLIITDTLTNNGIISADGGANSSGGSIYVTANNITGNGTFSADGGGMYSGGVIFGPGGGGRIALYYKASSFNGTAEAKGGCGSYDGWSRSCAGDGTIKMIDTSTIIPTKSSLKEITIFNITSLTPNVSGIIDENNHAISLTVPFGTDTSAIVPTIMISDKALINPSVSVAQNFTTPVTYTVTAEDGSTQNYVVTITVAPNPNSGTDTILPSITSYTFNGIAGDITINPLANSLPIVISASENVNWMSIKIEKQDNVSVYKTYQSGAGCVDGTNTCTKTWDGILTKGGLLGSQNGVYRIKVHIKDLANNEFYDYLTPYTITVNTN